MTDEITAQPIRVCFVILGAYPLFNPEIKKNFGGAEVDSYYLGTELAQDKQFEVSFIVGDYGQPEVEIREGVKIIKSADTTKSKIFWIRPLWRAMKQANADIYFRKMSSLVTGLTVLFCHIKKKKFIYRTANTQECDGTYLKEHWFRGRAYFWALHHANAIFCQHESGQQSILAKTGLRSYVVGNAHVLPVVDRYERSDILWVGRSDPIKRPDLFLKLAQEMPHLNFTMICQEATGDKKYPALVEQAEKIENLRFIQRVPFHEIDPYFAQARVFVNTSDTEGFPNTFIQACKWSTPILSLHVNPDGFIEKYDCGLFADGDWETFKKQLTNVMIPEAALKFGRHGRAYVEEKHDLSKIIHLYKNIFTDLVKYS
ncbi:glycosyltransferase family 4 protein [candidate division KSB1 bacterium]|nr:glycosyltransferase family 4 protein [candidate division KSB1 bacterium]